MGGRVGTRGLRATPPTRGHWSEWVTLSGEVSPACRWKQQTFALMASHLHALLLLAPQGGGFFQLKQRRPNTIYLAGESHVCVCGQAKDTIRNVAESSRQLPEWWEWPDARVAAGDMVLCHRAWGAGAGRLREGSAVPPGCGFPSGLMVLTRHWTCVKALCKRSSILPTMQGVIDTLLIVTRALYSMLA